MRGSGVASRASRVVSDRVGPSTLFTPDSGQRTLRDRERYLKRRRVLAMSMDEELKSVQNCMTPRPVTDQHHKSEVMVHAHRIC